MFAVILAMTQEVMGSPSQEDVDHCAPSHQGPYQQGSHREEVEVAEILIFGHEPRPLKRTILLLTP